MFIPAGRIYVQEINDHTYELHLEVIGGMPKLILGRGLVYSPTNCFEPSIVSHLLIYELLY
jgi:hypothetical protein